MGVSKMNNLDFKTTRIYCLHSQTALPMCRLQRWFPDSACVWKASYQFLRNQQWDYSNGWSELHPGLVGPGSRPCLTECSCAVSRHVEAGGPCYELRNQIEDLTGKGCSFLLDRRWDIYQVALWRGFALLLSILSGFCKPYDLGQRTRVILVYTLIRISFIHFVPIFIFNN